MLPSNSEKNLAERLADNVGEHVEAAAMGHPDHNFLSVVIGRETGKIGKNGDGGFSAFERKTLLGRYSGDREKFSKLLGFEQIVEHLQFFFPGQLERVLGRFHAFLQPDHFPRAAGLYIYSQPILPQ